MRNLTFTPFEMKKALQISKQRVFSHVLCELNRPRANEGRSRGRGVEHQIRGSGQQQGSEVIRRWLSFGRYNQLGFPSEWNVGCERKDRVKGDSSV